jgi:hypothetical protein
MTITGKLSFEKTVLYSKGGCLWGILVRHNVRFTVRLPRSGCRSGHRTLNTERYQKWHGYSALSELKNDFQACSAKMMICMGTTDSAAMGLPLDEQISIIKRPNRLATCHTSGPDSQGFVSPASGSTISSLNVNFGRYIFRWITIRTTSVDGNITSVGCN